jgi:hypothetical protein
VHEKPELFFSQKVERRGHLSVKESRGNQFVSVNGLTVLSHLCLLLPLSNIYLRHLSNSSIYLLLFFSLLLTKSLFLVTIHLPLSLAFQPSPRPRLAGGGWGGGWARMSEFNPAISPTYPSDLYVESLGLKSFHASFRPAALWMGVRGFKVIPALFTHLHNRW